MDRKAVAERLEAMRTRRPLVHCITNFVAMQPTANVLLAAGAVPAMVHDPAEAPEFAAKADALSVNIGTLSASWIDGIAGAVASASQAGRPWLLDPVAAGATAHRHRTATRLMAMRPGVIRANASEVLALAGHQSAGRGPDAADDTWAAELAAGELAADLGAVIAVTCETDFVTDGAAAWRVHGGAQVMTRVSGLGCALSALVAAFTACEADRLSATVAALACYAVAGERAAGTAPLPGSFAVAFLDALAALTPEMAATARVERA